MMERKLYKSNSNIKLDGVCAGIADYFKMDATLVRLLWVIGSIFTGGFSGLIAYFICAIIIPRQPDVY